MKTNFLKISMTIAILFSLSIGMIGFISDSEAQVIGPANPCPPPSNGYWVFQGDFVYLFVCKGTGPVTCLPYCPQANT